MQKSPIHYHEYIQGSPLDEWENPETGWYFYDETWADRHGPYLTREIAEYELRNYYRYALGDSTIFFSYEPKKGN